MLSTYDRIMSAPRITRTGATTYDNRSESELVKQLEAEVEALRKRLKEMTGKAAIALFSLAFLVGCATTPITYTSERCPAPLSPKGCYAHLERGK